MRILRLNVMPCSVVVCDSIVAGDFGKILSVLQTKELSMQVIGEGYARLKRKSKWYNFTSFSYRTFKLNAILVERHGSIDVLMHFKSDLHSWIPKIDMMLIRNEFNRLINDGSA